VGRLLTPDSWTLSRAYFQGWKESRAESDLKSGKLFVDRKKKLIDPSCENVHPKKCVRMEKSLKRRERNRILNWAKSKKGRLALGI
jgi:hypothetical protein